jgi:exosortase
VVRELASRDQSSRPLALTATLAVVTLLFVAMFWPTVSGLPATWLDKGGEGFVIAAFCAYLVWRDRSVLFDKPAPIGLASVITLGLSLLWLVALVLNVQVVHQAALPLIVMSWVLCVFGTRMFVAALPIAGAFFLSVPLWDILVPPLQSMTVAATSVLLAIFRLEAVVSGQYIKIPSGVFEVAAGCAGLNYLMTSLLIGVMYALLFLKSWSARIAAVALAVVIAVVSNWLRVFGLVVIGHYTKMQSPLIEDHIVYGWLIFAVVMIAFFILTKRIEAYDRKRSATESISNSEASARASLAGNVFNPRSVVLPSMAAFVGPMLFLTLGGRAATGAAPDRAPGVNTQSDWQLVSESRGKSNSAPSDSAASDSIAWSPSYRGANEHRVAIWRRDSVEVQVDRFLYTDQSQGNELIGNGNRIASGSAKLGEQKLGPLNAQGRMITATAVRTPHGVRLVWHWFSVGGAQTHSTVDAKLLELAAFAQSDVPPSELVSVSSLCGAENCDAANARLFEFVLGQAAPPLSSTR